MFSQELVQAPMGVIEQLLVSDSTFWGISSGFIQLLAKQVLLRKDLEMLHALITKDLLRELVPGLQ